MKSLAGEMTPDGMSNSMLLGIVSGMADFSCANAAYDDMIKTKHPHGPGCVDDVSEFVLSEKVKWISVQQILIDGAFSAHSNHVL